MFRSDCIALIRVLISALAIPSRSASLAQTLIYTLQLLHSGMGTFDGTGKWRKEGSERCSMNMIKEMTGYNLTVLQPTSIKWRRGILPSPTSSGGSGPPSADSFLNVADLMTCEPVTVSFTLGLPWLSEEDAQNNFEAFRERQRLDEEVIQLISPATIWFFVTCVRTYDAPLQAPPDPLKFPRQARGRIQEAIPNEVWELFTDQKNRQQQLLFAGTLTTQELESNEICLRFGAPAVAGTYHVTVQMQFEELTLPIHKISVDMDIVDRDRI